MLGEIRLLLKIATFPTNEMAERIWKKIEAIHFLPVSSKPRDRATEAYLL